MFSLIESIGLSILLVVVIVLLYVLLRKVNDKLAGSRTSLVFVSYLVFIIVFLGAVYTSFLVWNTTLFEVVGIEWETVTSFMAEKVGALISTVLIIFVGFGLIRTIKVIIVHSQKVINGKNTKRRKTMTKLIMSLVDYTLKIIVILIVLSIWGVNVVPAIAGLGILGLVIGFGMQDLMKDFIAGFFIIFEKHFDVGDIVEINGFKGEVIDIGLKTTKVMNWKKDIKLFNNSSVQNAINFSLSESMAIVEVGIAYDENVDMVIQTLNEKLAELNENNVDILENPTCVGVTNFSASSVDIRIVVKTATEKHYGVERLLRKEIKKIFDDHGIVIPFTQIVLHHEQTEESRSEGAK